MRPSPPTLSPLALGEGSVSRVTPASPSPRIAGRGSG